MVEIIALLETDPTIHPCSEIAAVAHMGRAGGTFLFRFPAKFVAPQDTNTIPSASDFGLAPGDLQWCASLEGVTWSPESSTRKR